MEKRLLGILFGLVMMLGLMPGMDLTAKADPPGADGLEIPTSHIVTKKNPTNTVEQLSAFVGQTLAEVALPIVENGVWNWMDDTTTTLNELGMTTHFAKFTPNDTENYNILENVGVSIQVTEKPMAVPATVTANDRTYDGTEKPLVNVDISTLAGGTMQYALGTREAAIDTYSASIPAATDAGTYYVWYKVVGDATHNDVAREKVSVSIGKADATITAKDQTIKEGESIAEGIGNVEVSGLLTGHRLDAISIASGTGETAGKLIASDARIKDGNNQDVTSNYTVVYTPGTLTVRAVLSRTVTFKVANGKWDDDSTADKTVTLTGYEGDILKLAANQIPAVGTKPNDTYKAGSWDVTPSAETEITGVITYTYTYAAKEASVVTKAPEAKTLTYNGSAQWLVTAGEASGGEMQYALGTATKATEPYTTSIPTKTDVGTYYVWYMVKGNENYNDSMPVCIPVTISEAETCTITFDAAGGIGSMDAVQIAKGDKFTFPTSAFVPPENQVFAHWRIGKNQYVVNDEITVNADLIVSAVWAEKKKEIKKNVLTSVPNELKNTFSSIDAIENALLDELSYKGMIVSKENSEFYDAVLMVQRDDGSWVKATKDDFPKGEKLSVILPYPDGTGMNTHNFRVAHMFSQKMYGHNPGEIEIPPLKKLKMGIQVDLDGLSPVAISWTKIDDTAIDSLPQTGDTERPLLYGLAVLAALIGLGLLIKKK